MIRSVRRVAKQALRRGEESPLTRSTGYTDWRGLASDRMAAGCRTTPVHRMTPMPLHDWSAQPGWDGVRQVWGVERHAIGGPDGGRPEVGEPRAAVPLSADDSVSVDLDGTYRRATEAAYLA